MASYKLSKDDRIVFEGTGLFRVLYTDGEIGGYIENYSNLSQLGRCRVMGEAKVFAGSHISDHALVDGSAVVSNASLVADSAWVGGDAIVTNSSRVYDNGTVCDNALVSGGFVLDQSVVRGNAIVRDRAIITGSQSISTGELKGRTQNA